MAIYHASMRMLSRSDRNTVKALAYRTGTDLYDERTGKWFYYSSKNVAHVELLLPRDAPAWAKELQKEILQDRNKGIQKLSNLAERAEKRKDSQVYREFEFALPKELTKEQNIKLANEFLQDQACQLGMVAVPSFHFEVDEETGEGRPHCHAIFLTRTLEEEGLCQKKETSWDRTEVLLTWREQLAGYINFYLKLYGHEARVDHRSYAEQGIDILPQPKLARGMKILEGKIKKAFQGKTGEAQVLEKRAQYEVNHQRNVARLIKNPHTVFDIVTRQYATFMWGDVEKVLARYVKEDAIYNRLHEKLKQSPELVLLREEHRPGEYGKKEDACIYTTRSMLRDELSLVKLAEKMGSRQKHKIRKGKLEKAIEVTNQELKKVDSCLSQDQIEALHHVTKSDQLSCVIGYAGAGKSTMFNTAKLAWEASGYKVYGLGPTGRAAQNLEEIGIKSQTIHKFLRSYEKGRCHYRKKSVLILDEAGMVDVRRFNDLLTAAHNLGIKLVISGDGAQAQPIEAGPGFRLVTDRLEVQKMDTVIRQKIEWQREATRLFGTYETKAALNLYLDRGHVQFVDEKVGDLHDLVSKDQHREVVKLYNLSRRIAGNLWHSITEDLQKKNLSSEEFLKEASAHVDFERFKQWQERRQSVACAMIADIDAYRPLMKQQGVEREAFAAQFVSHDLPAEDRAERIRELIKTWGLKALDSNQPLHVSDPRDQTRKELIQAWEHSLEQHPDKSHLISTYTNKDTSLLNQEARSLRRLKGHLAVEEYIHEIKRDSEDDFGQKITHTEYKAFAKGERVVFTQNDNRLDVKNGTLGTLVEVNQHTLKVRLDKVKSDDEERIVSFSSKLNPYFDQGWAITVTKSQGSTADRVFVLATFEFFRNLAYVAMTRHKEYIRVFGSKLDFWRPEIFINRLSQSKEKLSSLDHRTVEEAQVLLTAPARLKEALASLGDRLKAYGYYSQKNWERLCAQFTGETPRIEDRIALFSPTVEETVRAREMGLMMGPQDLGNIQAQGKEAGSSFAGIYGSGSGRGRGSVSSSLGIEEDVSAFIDRQAKRDALRDGFGNDTVLLKTRWDRAKTEPVTKVDAPQPLPVPGEDARSLHLRYKIYQESRPIEGTLAATYVQKHLKIQDPISSDLRFHPKVWHSLSRKSYPALVALARNKEGHIKALHQIYLDPITGEKALGAISQDTRGSLRGSYVEIQQGTGPTHIVKDLERALYLQSSGVEGSIYATLSDSNLKEAGSFLKDKSREVILYGEGSALQKGLDTLTAQGFIASINSLPEISETSQIRDLKPQQNERDLFTSKPLSFKALQNGTSIPDSLFSFQEVFTSKESDFTDLSAKSLLQNVVAQKVVFTSKDLERVVLKQVTLDPDAHLILQHKVAQQRGLALSPSEQLDAYLPTLVQLYTRDLLKDPEVQSLGENAKGIPIYTSAAYQQREQEIHDCLKDLQSRSGPSLEHALLEKAIDACQTGEGFIYSPEQRAAIDSFYDRAAVRMLTGQAGTGKTTVLKPVVEAYQQAGYTVIGTSFQGKVADMLSQDLNITGFTLHQLTGKWQEISLIKEKVSSGDLCPQDAQKMLTLYQGYQLTDRHVVIVDEGNMVPDTLWHSLLKEVASSGALLRIVGDNNQIKALEGGDISRLIEQEIGSQKLSEVHRQKVEWQKEATEKLNQHQLTAGLQLYEDHGHLKYHASEFSARYGLINAYLEGRHTFSDQIHMMLAYRRKDVEDLNLAVRERLKARGQPGEEKTFVSSSGRSLSLSLGEQVMFTDNDHEERKVLCLDRNNSQHHGIKNGTVGTVMSFDANKIQIQTQDGRLMGIDFKSYEGLTYAYAMTVNKAEGKTFDQTYGLYDRGMNANLFLIGASRHRYSCAFFIDQSQTPDLKALIQAVNKSDYRGLTSDSEKGDSLSFEKVKSYCDHLEKASIYRDQALAANALEALVREDQGESPTERPLKSTTVGSEEKTPVSELWDKYHEHRREAHLCARGILENWEQCAPFVQQAGIARDTLEFQAGLQKNLLSAAEEAALLQVDAYHGQAFKTKQLGQALSQREDKSQHLELLAAYTHAKSARNALAYDMMSSPNLYQPLLRIKQNKDNFVTVSDKTYESRPPGFKEIKDHAQEHFKVHLLERYEAAPDLSRRLALGQRFLSQLRSVDGMKSIRDKLIFEQRWAQEKGEACTLEALKQARQQYDALSNTNSNRQLSSQGIASVCHHLLGTPQLQNSTQLRYGQGHHLAISLEEGKAGVWHDFKSGDKGTLLQLIQREKHLSPEEAKFAIVHALHQVPQEKQASLLSDASKVKSNAEEIAQKQQKVQDSLPHLTSLTGSVADRYLTEHRHLSTARSEDIQYHAPREGKQVAAMVVLGRNHSGEVTCLQETYLNRYTAQKANFDTNKRSQGQISGSYGCVQKGAGPYILAEGTETALSLKEAGLKGDIYITFGISNFAHFGTFTSDRSRPVIIAADNDGENSQTQKQLEVAVSKLKQQGFKVFVVAPQEHKADYNDILQKGGVEAVRSCFEKVAHEIENFGFNKEVTQHESVKPSHPQDASQKKNSTSSAPSFYESKPFYRLEDVNASLTPQSIEYVCHRLMGGNAKTGRGRTELRYGKKNQFCISLNSGLWSDFASGEKGNLYQLAMREKRIEFKEALTFVGECVNAPMSRHTIWREEKGHTLPEELPQKGENSYSQQKVSEVQKGVEQKREAPKDMSKDIHKFKEREGLSVHNILTNFDKNTDSVAKIETQGVPQEPLQQMPQKSEAQERSAINDQAKVLVDKDAAASIAASSTQESAPGTSGFESEKSATETVQEVGQKSFAIEDMSKDIHKFIELSNKINQYKVLSSPQSKEIFSELKTIAGQWHQQPEFLSTIKATDNRDALWLANEYVTKHQQKAEVRASSSIPSQDFEKLEGDVQRFLDLTNKVSRYDVLGTPQSKEIFAELRTITDEWHQQSEFLALIKTTDNSDAIMLAEDYVKEHQKNEELKEISSVSRQDPEKLEGEIQRFLDLTNKVSQYDVLGTPQSKEIFKELKSIAGEWYQQPEFLSTIKVTGNSDAIMLAEDYVKEHHQNAELKAASCISPRDPEKLEGDVQRFLDLTNKVSQYDVLGTPQSKEIFKELKMIADQWHHQPEFARQVEATGNRDAKMLVESYARERERSQNRTQGMALEM